MLTRRESSATRDLRELDALWLAAMNDTDTTKAVVLQSDVAVMDMRLWVSGGWRSGVACRYRPALQDRPRTPCCRPDWKSRCDCSGGIPACSRYFCWVRYENIPCFIGCPANSRSARSATRCGGDHGAAADHAGDHDSRSLFWQQQVQVRSIENQRMQLQKQWILRGALDWAGLILREDANTQRRQSG